MLEGFATPEGTLRYAGRFAAARSNAFFREANGLTLSSLGLGSYLGKPDEETDVGYYAATIDAFRAGVNLFDTAINYRHQRSERALGSALRKLIQQGDASRDEFVICTKAGFLTADAIPSGVIEESDIIRGVHCIHPEFLKDQVVRSRENLGLSTIDIHYLHNPETQLAEVPMVEFHRRMRAAFEALEWCVSEGWIRSYGTATWDGYRRRDSLGSGLQLADLVALAKEVAGEGHHFRFVQLPFNLAMAEAFTLANQQVNGKTINFLDAASELDISVVASASILQSRLAQGLPDQMKTTFPDTDTDAQRAIQFARSAPAVTSALVGMSKREHVAENLGVAAFPPMPTELFRKLF